MFLPQHHAGLHRGPVHRLVEGDHHRCVELDAKCAVVRRDASDRRLSGSEAPGVARFQHAIVSRGQSRRDSDGVLRASLKVARLEAIERGVQPLTLASQWRVEFQHRRSRDFLQQRQWGHGSVELDQDLCIRRDFNVAVARDDVGDRQPSLCGQRVYVVRFQIQHITRDTDNVLLPGLPAGERRLEEQGAFVRPDERSLDCGGDHHVLGGIEFGRRVSEAHRQCGQTRDLVAARRDADDGRIAGGNSRNCNPHLSVSVAPAGAETVVEEQGDWANGVDRGAHRSGADPDVRRIVHSLPNPYLDCGKGDHAVAVYAVPALTIVEQDPDRLAIVPTASPG